MSGTKPDQNGAPIFAPQAMINGMRAAFGIPIVVLSSSYLGFGSLIRDNDLSVWLGVFSTFTTWALPGQIAMIELYGAGASILIISLTVSLINARFLPMAITVMPIIRTPGVPRWRYYFLIHLLSINSWAYLVQRGPSMPREERLPYYVGFAMTLWIAGMISSAVGYMLAGAVPRPVSLGLVYLNPIYFMLLMVVGLRNPALIIAMGFGVILGPLLHLVSSDWGLMLTGLIAGSAGYFGGRLWDGRRGGGHG